MNIKIFYTIIFLFIITSVSFGQSTGIITSSGKLLNSKNDLEVISSENNFELNPTDLNTSMLSNYNLNDTLDYNVPFQTRFGIEGQDILVQWFECPADLTLNKIAVDFAPATTDYTQQQVSVKVVKLNWDKQQILGYQINPDFLGYYSDNDSYGNRAPFQIGADGSWVSENAETSPFGEDLWSDNGDGYPLQPNDDVGYQWIDLSLIEEPQLQQGDIFGIVVKNLSSNLTGDVIRVESSSETSIPGFKFYQDGRFVTNTIFSSYDAGWWIRNYTWDFIASVSFSSDSYPIIKNITRLNTTLDSDSRRIEAQIIDSNPLGGDYGVDIAEIVCTVNNEYQEIITMTEGENNNYFGNIPGFSPGDTVSYKIRAVDVNGNENIVPGGKYLIFNPNNQLLTVVNGYKNKRRLKELLPKYFSDSVIGEDEFDIWYYGPVSDTLVSHYSSIIEIQMMEGTPTANNMNIYYNWIQEGNKNLMLCGQDQLGYLYGNNDSTFSSGDFEYDVLGIKRSYNNFDYRMPGDEDDPSELEAEWGTILGGALASTTTTVMYDPNAQGYMNPYANNYIDKFDPREDINTETFIGRYYEYYLPKPPVGHNWIMPNSSKIVFMAFDPLFLDEVGGSPDSPFNQAIKWFDGAFGENYNNTFLTGWNLSSIPVYTNDMSVMSLFPTTSANVYTFDDEYNVEDTIKLGEGYWVKFDDETDLSISGELINDEFSLELEEGWNLIGPYNNTIPVEQIETEPGGLLFLADFIGYDSGYYVADTLLPFKGYWIKSNGDGSISYNSKKVSKDKSMDKLNATAEIALTVSDGVNGNQELIVGQDPSATDGIDDDLDEYELPPLPPSGVFDARLELPNELTSPVDIREGGYTFAAGTEFIVQWQLGTGSDGFTLEWDLPGELTMTMQDLLGGVIVDETFGSGPGSYTITNENLSEVKITFEGDVPVELSSFTANAMGESVQLEWATASETNNAGFEIQRSEDNQSFSKVGYVEGYGTTSEKQEYTFTDNTVQNGTYYYRLKQVDLDGSYEYSDVVEADLALPDEFALDQNYPNPFNPSTTIKFALPVQSDVTVRLFNSLGQEVKELISKDFSAGIHTFNLNASSLSSGIYLYNIEANGKDGTNFVKTRKMILMK